MPASAIQAFDSPRLMADIGSRFVRFALETAPGRFESPLSLSCAEHAGFHSALRSYLAAVGDPAVQHAAVAVANPVDGDEVRLTNSPWRFSIEQTRQALGLDTLVVVNDFTALAMALPRLAPSERRAVGGGRAREASVIGLIGAGSGLGASGLVPARDGWIALGAEGGHGSFAPTDEREIRILRWALREFPHVSFERLLSGAGLELIHRALSDGAAPALSAPEITRRALAGDDALCVEVLDAFCAMLGTAAANLALTLGARGGIYLGGGIVPRLGTAFDRSPFRARFEDKGRFSDYLKAIPTWVLTAADATFSGAATILADQLRRRSGGSGQTPLLAQIERARAQLPPAERRVADHVLAHPRDALGEPVAAIARAAEVSQPTVIRFCRSLGCEGLSDFKLRLASGLGATVPLAHTQVTDADSMLDLGVKVLSNTASAILALRERIHREALDRALALLDAAERVEIYASGYSRVVADDALLKFLRLGVAAGAATDPRLQRLASQLLRPVDVAVIVSSSGHVEDLLAVADTARERGAPVLAITASHSPLAKKADVLIAVDHGEDITTQVPMVSRVLQLLVIDMLAVGVAMKRGAAVNPARPLAHLTSHSG
ncbi:MAG: glucokinase [Burkholderiales bacterium]|nr:glucokinase [Burkholderiales bacterium]